MIPEKEARRISKFLSLVLRHKPETIELNLDENGWADVDELLEKVNNHGLPVNRSTLEHVVATNNKKRFTYNDSGSKIRASQGHSINVDLGLENQCPPDILYHGTAERFLSSILERGLIKGSRQHVHLSQDLNTATKVGSRHGKPVILKIDALKMYKSGYAFYISKNRVWLTDHVPIEFIQPSKPQA